VKGDLPCKKVFEDEKVLAFHDVNPVAPVHVLIVPKEPVGSLSQLEPHHKDLMGHLILTAHSIAKQQNLSEGYRIVINDGPLGQQSVHWLHVHLISGRPMSWPPG